MSFQHNEKANAVNYAHTLMAGLNLPPLSDSTFLDIHPAINNVRSGVQSFPQGKNKIIPVALANYADGALLALKSIPRNHTVKNNLPESGASLLGERMALFNTQTGQTVSAGGSCHLLKSRDGYLAINLARDEDTDLLPALTNGKVSAPTDKKMLENIFKEFCIEDLIPRGRELGLAIAPVTLPDYNSFDNWVDVSCSSPSQRPSTSTSPLVVDLSSLWAGPLTGSLLASLGAEVIKVESRTRLDGARRNENDPAGEREFYNLMNGGKKSFTCDFTTQKGRQQLLKLIECADIVIESSRPRALRQLGIHAEKLVAEKPGKVWLSLTAYGRGAATENIIGFGDDIGVAAGLSALMEIIHGHPLFVGDAIADPLGGLHGALAAWSCWINGGGLINLALYKVLGFALSQDPLLRDFNKNDLIRRTSDWANEINMSGENPYPIRKASKPAPLPGQHNEEVLRKLDAL
jgi:hypothetical protein